MTNPLSLDTYDYNLPDELIAQFPAEPADSCKLLTYNQGVISDTYFSTLPSLLDAKKHIFFFNESKVLRARVPLLGTLSRTKLGTEKVFDGEIFYLRPNDEKSFVAMVYPGDRFPVGGTIIFDGIEIFVEQTVYEGRVLSIGSGITIEKFLEKYGQMPLPPYIQYSEDKESVYQPIFAKNSGSVASPTASLHFTDELLQAITEKGFLQETLTLHVGLGTFKNIYEQDIRDFEMHSESAEVSKDIFEKIASYKKDGKIVLAIGTTVTRTLETLPVLWTLISGKFSWTDECKSFWDTIQKSDKNIIPSFSIDGETIRFQSKIFIYPGFDFVVIDELITNFHLPKSTLLMLVSAFLGIEETKKIYTYARGAKYRFFSFGDAMYLRKKH